MKIISSAEFRKSYPRLEEQTVVTANGHAIGRWTPAYVLGEDGIGHIDTPSLTAAPVATPDGRTLSVPSTQVERDRILRRINKGG